MVYALTKLMPRAARALRCGRLTTFECACLGSARHKTTKKKKNKKKEEEERRRKKKEDDMGNRVHFRS